MNDYLRPEIRELLSGFEKRMKFINIAKSLVAYSYKDNIRAMVPDREILDNLIAAVLVYIKERTLGREQSCRLEDIAGFLEELSPVLPEGMEIDPSALARFIVVDVLQNGGELKTSRVLVPDKGRFEPAAVRLIEEERGAYHLTDDAFDFLFRSKEIESELDYSVTRFRMAEYMKRDNYAEALDQSRELVSRIRSMKVSMDDFLRRCRENISKISVDQYENVIIRVRNLLETEYEELKIIQDSARERSAQLYKAQQSGVTPEETRKHRKALVEIIENIQQTIEEQRSLINRKMTLSDAYQKILSDSYAINRYERLSFDRDMLSPLRSGRIPFDKIGSHFLFPLVRPAFENMFSVENLYSVRMNLSEDETEVTEDIDSIVQEEDQTEIRNSRNLRICSAFFGFLIERDTFTVREWITSLSDESRGDFCQENAMPHMILTLYSLQKVSISDWKKDNGMIAPPMGELELGWCLSQMPQEYLEIEAFTVTRLDRDFSFSADDGGTRRRISMTDFLIEVER